MTYTTETRLGQDYFIAQDGYGSFNESYVREHCVIADRQRAAAAAAQSNSKKSSSPASTDAASTPDTPTTSAGSDTKKE